MLLFGIRADGTFKMTAFSDAYSREKNEGFQWYSADGDGPERRLGGAVYVYAVCALIIVLNRDPVFIYILLTHSVLDTSPEIVKLLNEVKITFLSSHRVSLAILLDYLISLIRTSPKRFESSNYRR